jgi:alkyldihydroxyacetonephosphate synthase
MLEIVEEKKLGWIELGSEKAEDWWANRYKVSYRQQQILSHSRLILDTFEISAPFSKLPLLHKSVKNVVESFKSQEFLVLLAHFSHFYHTGGNIYFTLCGRSSENFDPILFYDQVWEKLMQTVVSLGGALSHHHGIGRLKAKYLQEQTGPLHGVLKQIKHELDPKHLFNPENLGL